MLAPPSFYSICRGVSEKRVHSAVRQQETLLATKAANDGNEPPIKELLPDRWPDICAEIARQVNSYGFFFELAQNIAAGKWHSI
jgi:hypothetical protein